MAATDPLETLLTFIRVELVGKDASEIAADADLLGGGLIDSMGVMRLVTFLETECAISVRPEDVTIENFETPDTIARYVTAHQQGED